MPPPVSVVVPTHDRSQLLAVTLRSILWQEGVDYEVIVVDDGSSDDTATVVAGVGDDRVRLVRHDIPLGVSAARNRGIAESRGKWVAFCDDDDLWAPDKLAKQLHAGTIERHAWVCAGHVDVNPRLRVIGGGPPPTPEEIVRLLPFRNVVPGGGSGVIVLRETLARVGGFDDRLHNTEDWELWLRLARVGSPGLVREPLVAYRVHSGGASLNHAVMLADVDIIERTHGIRVSRAALHRYMGWWTLRAGRHGRALRHFSSALRHRDAFYSTREVVGDLAFLFRDALMAVPTRGRMRARPRSRQEEPVLVWRQAAQVWLDLLVEPAVTPVGRESSEPADYSNRGKHGEEDRFSRSDE